MNSLVCICLVVGLIFLAVDSANGIGIEPSLSPHALVVKTAHVVDRAILAVRPNP